MTYHKSKTTCIILLIGLLTLSSCSTDETITTPEPEPFNKDLVGCWELTQSDELFEGDLFVTLDGKATEYAVYGRTILTNQYDFLEVDYSLIDDELTFEGRIYHRGSNDEPVTSPCKYFPDEGMVKVFLVNDGFCLIVKVGYDRDKELFFERRSIWSRSFKLEQDIMEYDVTSDKVYIDPGKIEFDPDLQVYWAKDYPPAPSDYRYIDKLRVVPDTTIAIGRVRSLEHYWYHYNNRIINDYFDKRWLLQLDYGRLGYVYFISELGSVMLDYYFSIPRYPRFHEARWHHVELIDYFNPLKTVKTILARRDYRHMQRIGG